MPNQNPNQITGRTKEEISRFFDKWTPDMAYILGYFAADGSMYVNPKGYGYISFCSTDAELIIQVKKIMGVPNKIEIYDSKYKSYKRRYTLQIGNKQQFNRLIELGFTPRKSLTLQFPEIPAELVRHFIRGYFDGDGCAYLGWVKRKDTKKGIRKLIEATFTCGSKSFIEKLQAEITKEIDIKGVIKFRYGAYTLAYRGGCVIKLYGLMYPTQQVVCLKRKQDILRKGLNILGP